MVTLDGHIPQDLTFFISHYPLLVDVHTISHLCSCHTYIRVSSKYDMRRGENIIIIIIIIIINIIISFEVYDPRSVKRYQSTSEKALKISGLNRTRKDFFLNPHLKCKNFMCQHVHNMFIHTHYYYCC